MTGAFRKDQQAPELTVIAFLLSFSGYIDRTLAGLTSASDNVGYGE